MRAIPGMLLLAGLVAACTGPGSQATTTTFVSAPAATSTTLVPAASSTTRPPSVTQSGDVVTISGDNSFPDGFTVPAGETWVFDPEVSTTVTVDANVIVLGTLVMQPASGDIEHILRFEGVDESRFQGGGMNPVDTDVGLWVVGDGQLILEGEPKTAWAYAYDPAWDGDEVIAAPNTPGDYSGFYQVTSTPPPNALGYPTELLDLTRNVRIEGTEEGHAHVFIRSTKPQTIRYVALRYMGPDPGNFSDTDQTGRYALHFHHNGDGSRGTIVEGVVVRDAANHAFVPHASHGITFRDDIAYDVASEAYWWDPPTAEEDYSNDTNDLVYDRLVAAGVVGAPGGDKHRLSAFFLGRGQNVTVNNSVAVGIQNEGGADRSGFEWPENAEATWVFQNDVAHNNGGHGIFVWQNNELPHLLENFTAYYNQGAGISHGAYKNSYEYQGLTLLDNGVDVLSHALGKPEETGGVDTQIWADVRTDGGDLVMEPHRLASDDPVRFLRCDFADVYVQDAEAEPGVYDFIDCGLEPSDFDLSEANPGGVFRVQRADGTAYRLSGDGTVTEIPPFYDQG